MNKKSLIAVVLALVTAITGAYHYFYGSEIKWPTSYEAAKPAGVSKHIPLDQTPEKTNFNQAKTRLVRAYRDAGLETTLYCDCKYSANKVDWQSCGYKPRANAARAARIEWEHVLPAANVTKMLSCSNRKDCEAHSGAFNNFEGDMHNLRPEVGELNGDHSNYPWGIVSSKPRNSAYGSCQFWVGLDKAGQKVAEPADGKKGDVARVVLYLADKYSIPLPNRELMLSWHRADPVSDHERQINTMVKRMQGDGNAYIEGSK